MCDVRDAKLIFVLGMHHGACENNKCCRSRAWRSCFLVALHCGVKYIILSCEDVAHGFCIGDGAKTSVSRERDSQHNCGALHTSNTRAFDMERRA